MLTDQPNDLTLVELEDADAATNEEVRARATQSSKSYDTTLTLSMKTLLKSPFCPSI